MQYLIEFLTLRPAYVPRLVENMLDNSVEYTNECLYALCGCKRSHYMKFIEIYYICFAR